MTTLGLVLQPLDVLFFRDGRPFGAANRVMSGLPTPQTVAGALRTALLCKYGCDFPQMKLAAKFTEAVQKACPQAPWIADIRFRGPWFCRWCETAPAVVEVLVPAPTILHTVKGQQDGPLVRLAPLTKVPLPGWDPRGDQAGLLPLWHRSLEPTEAVTGYLTPAGLQKFLNGGIPDKEQVICSESLYGFDHRTGIEINPDRLTAAESQIYGATFLALRTGVGLYAEVEVPAEQSQAFAGIDVIALGGEGRRASLSVRPANQWPQGRGSGKPLILLTTPGLFLQRWRPSAFNGQLVAAAVPGAVTVSGWDLARSGPKRTRFAASAGSVYFLNEGSEDMVLCEADDAALGWGCYLKGVWNDK